MIACRWLGGLVALGGCGVASACVQAGGEAAAAPAAAQTVAAFEPGDSLESVAAAPDGDLYVCLTRASGAAEVVRVRRGERTTVATLPASCNLARRGDGSLWASAGGPEGASSLWWVDAAGGASVRVATLPLGVWANGVAALSDGAALVADSAGGRVWRLRPPAYAPEVWLEHPLLRGDAVPPDLPSANGIEATAGAVIVSNSDARRLVRVAVSSDGAAGDVREVASGIAIDDFAIAADGTIFATTHAFNTVVRLVEGLEPVDVLTAAGGAVGPSAADFGRAPGDETSLYVVTDGNSFGRRFGGSAEPLVAPVLLRLAGAAR